MAAYDRGLPVPAIGGSFHCGLEHVRHHTGCPVATLPPRTAECSHILALLRASSATSSAQLRLLRRALASQAQHSRIHHEPMVLTPSQVGDRHDSTGEFRSSSESCASRAATVAAQPGFECQFTKPAAGAGLRATLHTGMGVGRVTCKASPAPARSGGPQREVGGEPTLCSFSIRSAA